MSTSRALHLRVEVALASVTVAVVVGMVRLFEGTSWLGPLVVNALAAHALAAVTRRRGFSLPSAAGAMAIGAALVATWTCYWGTTALGIPTGSTVEAMRTDLQDAWTLYQDVVAPAPVQTGFVLASALALWAIAYVADWAAFRLWVPFESTLPAGTLFLFTALLGTAAGRGWTVALFAGTVLGFILLHRMARQDSTSHWVSEGRHRGQRALLGAGATVAAVAVVVGAALGPALPGAGSPGVLDPRDLRDDRSSRVTISPLVDIRSRLVDQSNVEVFRVRSPEPSYWRLTSLERFDGRIWSSSGSYADADGELPSAGTDSVATHQFEQVFTVASLAAIWLPAAYEPQALSIEGARVLYDEDSSTLTVDSEVESSDSLVYRVRSASPRLTEADLQGAGGEVPRSIQEENTALPEDFSPRVRDLALEITAGTTGPYEAALALQDHLRTFTYDLSVRSGHRSDDIDQFLFETQRGYCEQFAGAFAAMARSIGLPARVAVGFTQGETDPAEDGLYVVRGEHAHAWPEVYLAGAGWVAFEPTPGRGMPFAESYTGVEPAQAAPGSPAESESVTTTTATPTGGPDPTPEQPEIDPGELETTPTPDPIEVDQGESSGLSRYVIRPLTYLLGAFLLAAVLHGIGLPLLLLLRRRRRRSDATTPVERIEVAFIEAAEAATQVGYREQASDTPAERARRLAGSVTDDEAGAAALTLAHHLEVATYSEVGAEAASAEASEAAAATIVAAANAQATWAQRAQHWFDPRPHVRRWRLDQGARQRRITTTARADLEVERELVGSGDRR